MDRSTRTSKRRKAGKKSIHVAGDGGEKRRAQADQVEKRRAPRDGKRWRIAMRNSAGEGVGEGERVTLRRGLGEACSYCTFKPP